MYAVINSVLGEFGGVFLDLFRATAGHVLSDSMKDSGVDENVARQMELLTTIFYDLVSQDLPPILEDSHVEFFASPNGYFPRLLSWSPKNLVKGGGEGDEGDTEPSWPSKVKTNILEILELYIKRYAELFQLTDGVDAYVKIVWGILSPSTTPGTSSDSNSETPNPHPFTSPPTSPISDTPLQTQSLRFLSTSITSNLFPTLFTSTSTIALLTSSVLIPHMLLTNTEIEQFEDDPIEWIRADLFSLSFGGMGSGAGGGVVSSTSGGDNGGGGGARRQAAAEVLRAFVGVNNEGTVGIVSEWVGRGLEIYKGDPGGVSVTPASAVGASTGASGMVGGGGVGKREVENWKIKDCAVFAMSAVAVRGSTSSVSVLFRLD